ncbi:MAG: DUF1365 domain-containing protein [Bacteroidota bacterium]
MNSSLYECHVMHHRLEPLRNRFVYKVFMFALDLDETGMLHTTMRLFSRNRRNVFQFREKDHLDFGKPTLKENINEYLRRQGIELNNGKIILVTNLRTFGYIFNPVSFYFCFDASGAPVCAIAEVGNTFGEMKPYLLGPQERTENGFRLVTKKLFYVSPFLDLDATFDFQLNIPGEKMQIIINDYKDEKKIFLSSVTGVRKPLTDARLLWYTVRFPFVTLKVITLIHWQALKLVLKKLPYLKKDDHPELQQGAVQWNK